MHLESDALRIPRQLKTWKAALLGALTVLLAVTLLPSLGPLSGTRATASSQRRTVVSQAPSDEPAPSTTEAPAPVLTGNAPAGSTKEALVMGQLSAPAAPDPSGTVPAARFAKVKALQPRLRLRDVDTDAVAERVRRIDGVTFATAIEVGRVPVKGRNVTVAAVNPRQFRRVTPQLTADEVGVWQRIVEGDAAFTHDTGTTLGAKLGATVKAGADGSALRVGAYASNGVPPVADLLVNRATAKKLRLRGRRHVLVALSDDADAAAVASQIETALGVSAGVLAQPETQRAFLVGEDAREEFEPYTYVDMGDGMIQIDADWVQRNIVSREVPVLTGAVTCHRRMVDQLAGALGEIEEAGLAELIDTSDYGGCWVPRHIDFNPARPLSMHSWGLAVDLNVSTNGLGQPPTMDPRIVEIFDRWGFAWGGRWSRPDGMHFELGALLEGPQG